MYFAAIALTVVSNVLYHLFQKSTPGGVNPVLALAVTYALATAISLLLLPAFPLAGGLVASLRQVNWASFGLALAIVGLELGFLLAYRAGWNLSTGGLVSNVTVAIVLLPLGLLLFREQLQPRNYLGIALCLAGLALINWK